MRMSLFRKILLVYVGVVVLALGSLSAAVDIGVKHFIVHERVMTLAHEASVLAPLIEHGRGAKTLSLYERIARRNQRAAHSTVAIIGLFPAAAQGLRPYRPYLTPTDAIAPSMLKKLQSGHRTYFVGRLIPRASTRSLVVGVPLRRRGEVVGALVLHTPLRYLALGRIARVIVLVALPTVLLSILALYWATRRFAKPLASVARAAESLGQGHFHERVRVESSDEIGQLAETFNEMASRLEALENLRRDLIADVSHELRTPLTSVRGFVQGMWEGVIPASEHPRYLATAHRELERLNRILETMLDLSAIESGHIDLHFEAVRWDQTVHEVVERVRVRLDAAHIGWRESLVEGCVWVDRDRLTDVLFNLIDNAIRHTPEGGEISIQSHISGRHLVITLKDSGEGITPNDLPRIWERFFSGASPKASDSPRTGLGLTVTRHLVELMHGHIDVASEPGRGTTFFLRFSMVECQSSVTY